MPDLDKLARGLTDARKRMILALPSDGSRGAVPERRVAVRAWYSLGISLVHHKHCPEDRNEWALTDIALALKAHIERTTND